MLTLEERFWEKVDKNGPTMPHMSTNCWVWTGARVWTGHGRIRVGDKTKRANRIAMSIQGLPLKDDELSCHKCDNASCVRGEHLYAGSYKDNKADAVSRKRDRNGRKTHCKADHEFTHENTYISPSNGSRHCRTCARIADSKRIRTRKAA